MPQWAVAGLWGSLGGSALVLGATAGWFFRLPRRVIAGVMAAGAGVLISAVAFELIEQAARQGGLLSTGVGFVAGALVYTLANVALARYGAKHRKRSGSSPDKAQPSETGGLAIAVGALLDGVPESIVIGVSLLGGGAVGVATVAAVFLSNIPEGLSSAAGMKQAGRSFRYVFGVWGGIAAASGLAAVVGSIAFADAPPPVIAAVTAVAAGAILAMLVDTMIPEAFETAHDYAGLITVIGFLAAFALTRLA